MPIAKDFLTVQGPTDNAKITTSTGKTIDDGQFKKPEIEPKQDEFKKYSLKSEGVTAELSLEQETKKCPACAESIRIEAIKCRFCGERFDPEEVARQIEGILSEIKNQRAKLEITEKENIEAGKIKCQNCGNWNSYRDANGNLFCPNCQKVLPKMKTESDFPWLGCSIVVLGFFVIMIIIGVLTEK